jgi:hypothetical protein
MRTMLLIVVFFFVDCLDASSQSTIPLPPPICNSALGWTGSAWTCGDGRTQRTMLTTDLDWYYNCSTGSNSNTGTAAAPFSDPQYAYNLAQQTLDLGGKQTITVHGQSGCDGVAWIFEGPLIGAKTWKNFVIDGGGQTNVVSSRSRGVAFETRFDAAITVQNLACTPGSEGRCFVADNAWFRVTDVWAMTNGGNNIFDAAGPRAAISAANVTISQSGADLSAVMAIEDHAVGFVTGAWTINDVGWRLGFVATGALGGGIDMTGFSYSGSGRGPRCSASNLGIVFTNEKGQKALPGTSECTVTKGGLVD